MNTWPDGAMTPFRNEKNSNWEGAYRVPELIRWPGKIPAGVVSNEIIAHLDWLPTFLAAAGEPEIVEKLKQGYEAGNKTFKVHLDGYNLLPYLTGEEAKSPRQRGSSTSPTMAIWSPCATTTGRLVFLEQTVPGHLADLGGAVRPLRVPKIFNLRTDPFERADITSNTYYDWLIDRVFLMVPAQAIVAEFLGTFQAFPPRQKAASFTIDQVMDKLTQGAVGGH